MPPGVDDRTITIAPSSLVRVQAPEWTEPVDEAAQCLVSMSSRGEISARADSASNGPALASSSAVDATCPIGSPSRAPRAPRSKPDRLALACSTCRKRKVRCDAHQPKCHNCLRRGDVCITSDPRRPGASVPARRKTNGKSARPPSAKSERLLARQAEQSCQRGAMAQVQRFPQPEDASRQDAICASQGDLEQDQEVDVRQNDRSVIRDYLEPGLEDHAFSRPRLVSHSFSETSVRPHIQTHSEPQPQPVQQQVHQPSMPAKASLSHLAACEAQPPLASSGFSPASVGSGISLPNGQVAPSHSHNSNKVSSTGGDTELPSWVTRAYHEIAAQQVRWPDKYCPADASRSEEQPDPMVTTPDVVISSDGSAHRLKVVGGSSLQCLIKFTDVLLSGYDFEATAPLFRHGMAQSDEVELSLFPSLPNLPPKAVVRLCMDAFFDRIWPLFPAVDRDAVQADANTFLALQEEASGSSTGTGTLQSKIQANRVPNLVMVYGIICIGMNETSSSHPLLATCDVPVTGYLTASYGLHAHLTALPYQPSVQALLVLVLSLRGCGKEGQSWYILGLAIRLAVSIGLHKSVEAPQQQRIRLHDPDSLARRVWLSCFSLERLLQLECGRPSSIDKTQDNVSVHADLGVFIPGLGPWQSTDGRDTLRKSFTDDDLRSRDASTQDHGSPDEAPDQGVGSNSDKLAIFPAWVSLAAIMGQISDRFYNHRFGRAIELLSETARLARYLTRWEASLPDSLKPQSVSLSAPVSNAQVLTAFLAQQFYHAKIAVLRIAVLFPQHSFQNEVQLGAREMAEIGQLLGSASHCLNASRSLTTLTLQLADAGIHSLLISVPQAFLASIVLALSILRAPRSRLARADVELLTEATAYVEGRYEAWGYPRSFLSILSRLREGATMVSRGHVRPVASFMPAHTIGTASRISPRTDHQKEPDHYCLPNDGVGTTTGLDVLPGQSDAGAIGRRAAVPSDKSASTDKPRLVSEGGNNNGTGNGSATMAALAGDTGTDAFSSMDFENFWDMLRADIFM